MTRNIRDFPGVKNSSVAMDEQPDEGVIKFCEDLVIRARAGHIRAIAVAMVRPGRVTLDGWHRATHGADCAHELMASITYLQNRYASEINDRADRDER